ncbi:hypothetical protein [uncultured Oxalicibacterium sp.]|uniref:hypothetical protein n=1 Tax=uncultured Oxalicibacterium sp. TaxID=1168540 RepID=UPI0025D740C7|nr:hypothetical protein [uncultured Oxalicibacterium sp.]
MPSSFPTDSDLLRAEIAAAAARLIAEEGADYATAKRKAARQILGNNKVRGDVLPDNAMVEDEVRAYNALFFADTQPARLRHLRELAVRLMRELQQFQPYLTGAVLNGTAGEHSDIHMQLFADSPKDVEIFLLNKGIDFEVSESPHINRQEEVEVLSFLWQNEGVHLALYETDALRAFGTSRKNTRIERAALHAVEVLLAAPESTSPESTSS